MGRKKRGRGKKVIPPLRMGLMARNAVQAKLLTKTDIVKGKGVGDLSDVDIRKLARRLKRKYGAKRARGMFQAQVTFRKRMPDGFKRKMEIGREEVVRS